MTTEETVAKPPHEDELAELGFTAASTKIKSDKTLARKLRIAFEHFRVVEPDKINRFNKELMERTKKNDPVNQYSYIYDRLAFTPIANYQGVPPAEVLEKIKEAKKLECFDSFEVATIESVQVVPDPIIFGVINGSPNKYFISQWDEDVRIEDILKEDEG